MPRGGSQTEITKKIQGNEERRGHYTGTGRAVVYTYHGFIQQRGALEDGDEGEEAKEEPSG